MSKPLFAIATLTALAGAIAIAQPTKDSKPAAAKPSSAAPAHQPATTAKPTDAHQPAGEMPIPPGMTSEDMEACMTAATPGEMHAWLTESVGTWKGKCIMWMTPDSGPATSECITVISSFLDGRFIKTETTGDFAGMPFQGYGITGFDNVSQKFQSTWCDSMGTGMMTGTGERTGDGATVNFAFTFNCPINKGPVNFRQVEKRTGKDTMTLEMYGPAPHTNKEYKCAEIEYTRTSGTIIGNGGRVGTTSTASTPADR